MGGGPLSGSTTSTGQGIGNEGGGFLLEEALQESTDQDGVVFPMETYLVVDD